MWKCKDCGATFARRSLLLKHYKIHRHYGRQHSFQCLHYKCPCTFKTWNALLSHLTRCHRDRPSSQTGRASLKCLLCHSDHSTLRNLFQHLSLHLKNSETVACVFQNCEYKTNIYSSFHTHKSRKHRNCLIIDLKAEILQNYSGGLEPPQRDQVDQLIDCDTEDTGGAAEEFEVQSCKDLQSNIDLQVAAVLFKLEHIYLVSSAAVNELLQELDYLIGTLSIPLLKETVAQHLQNSNCQVTNSVIQELALTLSKSHPVTASFSVRGPLSTAWKRKVFYNQHFHIVEPVEYVINLQSRQSFQYIPILKTLQQVLSCDHFLNNSVHLKSVYQPHPERKELKSFFDGNNYINSQNLSKECAILITLYVDDFEICNPIGTSRRKYKICGVYWALGNLPSSFHSSLSNIYLAALVHTEHVKTYGYEAVLKPLLDDLITLEKEGLFVEKLGKSVKGFVHCIIADNLGAHGLAGFVESFSGKHICRFCTAQSVDIQTKAANREGFCLRTADLHKSHLQYIKDNSVAIYSGVKRSCVFAENLSYFSVTQSFPPDLVHDLFEGIVPYEVALCLSVFISKKYFSLLDLNNAITTFPLKWTDKTNRPHLVPATCATKRTIGGNAHENWCLLRFLPFFIGSKVPSNEPAWQVLCDLKDIVELVVSPTQTEDSISYLDFKITEHRTVFKEVFPNERVLPKHHYLEHYPHLMQQFGPLVALWTIRFEAKHSFFKRVVRHMNCYKNVLLSLAQRHQFQTAYNLYTFTFSKPLLEVAEVHSLPVEVLHENIVLQVKQNHPELDYVDLADNVTHNGFNYRIGMVVAHGSLAGLPEFCEIINMIILKDKLFFIVKNLEAWYLEHYRAYCVVLSKYAALKLVGKDELSDQYPLIPYFVGGHRLISLKRYIHV